MGQGQEEGGRVAVCSSVHLAVGSLRAQTVINPPSADGHRPCLPLNPLLTPCNLCMLSASRCFFFYLRFPGMQLNMHFVAYKYEFT